MTLSRIRQAVRFAIASGQPPAGVLTASRVTGVAPLSVYFEDSDAVVASTVGNRPFHDIGYIYDFGDTGAGVWATTGLSRNSAIGGISTHVFETPGVYTVTLTSYNLAGQLGQKTIDVTVTDPEIVYAGALTTVVNTTNDFTGAPTGAIEVVTTDVSTISQSIGAGERILFMRGSTWTVNSGPDWTASAGPVTIGAFGAGNDPLFNLGTGVEFFNTDSKQDWRMMDLEFDNPAKDATGAVNGSMNMQRILMLRLKVRGCDLPINWTHWNQTPILTINEMVIQDCDIKDNYLQALYVGGEKCAYMGNFFENSDESHTVRFWYMKKSTLSHNYMSGSSITSVIGYHALKMHGPADSEIDANPSDQTTTLPDNTRFAVIDNNIIGGSGPWQAAIGPQNAQSDEKVFDILFDSNRLVAEYGIPANASTVSVALFMWNSYSTVRNCIFDGTGGDADYRGVAMDDRGAEGAQTGVECYNNTVYRSDNTTGDSREGFSVGFNNTNTVLRNNLVSFPNLGTPTAVIVNDASSDLVQSNNSLVDETGFIDPDNVTPLSRDFGLLVGSAAIGAGVDTNAFKDIDYLARTSGSYDLGAYKYVG